jgi:hypothetical protein
MAQSCPIRGVAVAPQGANAHIVSTVFTNEHPVGQAATEQRETLAA